MFLKESHLYMKKNNGMKPPVCGIILIVLIVLIHLISIIFFSEKYVQKKKRFFRMDTVTEITVVVNEKSNTEVLWGKVDSLLKDWDERFSVSNPHSEVKAVNERKEPVIKVSSEMAEMLSRGISYGEILDGGFDMTILPIKELWGFVSGNGADTVTRVPSEDMVRRELAKVNFRNVTIEGNKVSFKSPETRIDVGGIAKGFVLAEIGKLLESNGISNFLISAGGDILTSGERIDGNAWRVGIADPHNSDSAITTIYAKDCVIVTSGDYERFKIIDGKRYHHLFDSKTGYSCSKNRSVTICGKDPVEADVFSTGLFALDPREIVAFVNERSGLNCFVIDSAGKIYTSKNWNVMMGE